MRAILAAFVIVGGWLLLFDITLVALSACSVLVLWVFAYAAARELCHGPLRALISFCAALLSTMLLAIAVIALAPDLPDTHPYLVITASIGFFLIFALLPAYALIRLWVWFDPGVRAARAGEYYVNVMALDPDVARIVAKRTGGTFRRPWVVRQALVSDGGRLTNRDVQILIRDERKEQEELARAYEAESRAYVAASTAARSASLTDFLGKLSPEERALFEANMRARAQASALVEHTKQPGEMPRIAHSRGGRR